MISTTTGVTTGWNRTRLTVDVDPGPAPSRGGAGVRLGRGSTQGGDEGAAEGSAPGAGAGETRHGDLHRLLRGRATQGRARAREGCRRDAQRRHAETAAGGTLPLEGGNGGLRSGVFENVRRRLERSAVIDVTPAHAAACDELASEEDSACPAAPIVAASAHLRGTQRAAEDLKQGGAGLGVHPNGLAVTEDGSVHALRPRTTNRSRSSPSRWGC